MPVDRPSSSRPVAPYRPPAGETGSETPSSSGQGRTRPSATGELASLRQLDRQTARNARQFTESGIGVSAEPGGRWQAESSGAGTSRPVPPSPFRSSATPPRSPFGRRAEHMGASTSASPLRSPMGRESVPVRSAAMAPSGELDRLRRMTEVAFPYESMMLLGLRDIGRRPEERQLEMLQRQEQALREALPTPQASGFTIDRGSVGNRLRADFNHIELRDLLPRRSRGALTPSDALRRAADNIVEHARRHFRAFAANPPPPLPPMTQPSSHHSADIMKAMLKEAPGIVIGEAHSSVSSKRVLVKHMRELKKAGVKTLFMEHLCADVHGPALAQYMAAPPGSPMPERLAIYLNLVSEGHMVGCTRDKSSEGNKYNFTTLVQAAKQAGLNIVPIDTAATYILSDEENTLGYRGDRERARTEAMNFVAAEKIRLLAGDGKWIAFVGNSHASTYQGTPGLAQLTGTRAMFIDDVGDSTKARVAVNVRDYLNLGVLSADIVLSYKK